MSQVSRAEASGTATSRSLSPQTTSCPSLAPPAGGSWELLNPHLCCSASPNPPLQTPPHACGQGTGVRGPPAGAPRPRKPPPAQLTLAAHESSVAVLACPHVLHAHSRGKDRGPGCPFLRGRADYVRLCMAGGRRDRVSTGFGVRQIRV